MERIGITTFLPHSAAARIHSRAHVRSHTQAASQAPDSSKSHRSTDSVSRGCSAYSAAATQAREAHATPRLPDTRSQVWAVALASGADGDSAALGSNSSLRRLGLAMFGRAEGTTWAGAGARVFAKSARDIASLIRSSMGRRRRACTSLTRRRRDWGARDCATTQRLACYIMAAHNEYNSGRMR